jgi:hypothetical protein
MKEGDLADFLKNHVISWMVLGVVISLIFSTLVGK